MNLTYRIGPALLGCFLWLVPMSLIDAQQAVATEEQRTLLTYPFSDPNPIPILTSNPKIYPYFKYEGYAHEGKPQDWKVVKLENDYVEVYVLPEVGGKVWGAVEKSTGEEFIYRNEVMKFRNISMRGPWTSGGIEFNFGIIGHHPSTATPVDYVVEEHEDGSVSCTVGAIDLPSRTQWRVQVYLPKDKAQFETRVTWYNPTPLHQAYYNWMTGAAFATPDLEFYTPGNQYLQHSGQAMPWPYDERGRNLSRYRENNFGPSKSYHVVGEYNDFFGGYFREAGYGFGHWAPYEEIPGQKLWLWTLSRSGGIWEDLLTDTDGQYIEFQAGRLFVQYSPGEHENPITQATFEPYTTDRWREVWFPVKQIGGLSDVSETAVLHVEENGNDLQIGVNALEKVAGTLEVISGDDLLFSQKIDLSPMGVFSQKVNLRGAKQYEVRIKEMDLCYSNAPSEKIIQRPFDAGRLPEAVHSAQKIYQQGMEDMKFRVYDGAMEKFRQCLDIDPYHSGAMCAMASLYFDRGEYVQGLEYANRALRLDTYDPHANYVAAILYRGKGDLLNAKESLGWAARSMTYRSAAFAQMAEIFLAEKDYHQAAFYARKALDFNRYNVNALQVLAAQARKTGDETLAGQTLSILREIDPLSHFVYLESYLLGEEAEDRARFVQSHRSELPYQTYLELAVSYVNLGLEEEALTVLKMAPRHPVVDLWQAYLQKDTASRPFNELKQASPELVFPYRRETLDAVAWAAGQDDHWKFKYYLALNLWGKGRLEEAAHWMEACGDMPDYAYFYLGRADLLQKLKHVDPLADLQRAFALASTDWRIWHALTDYYFNHARYPQAVENAQKAYRQFPDSYVMGMDLARAQVYNGQYEEAAQLLDKIEVLPFEGASEGHQLFAWAHTGRALNLMEKKQFKAAVQALEKAKEWPERLGVGKPYDPEERLQNYLLAACYEKTGEAQKAQKLRQNIVEQTRDEMTGRSRLHLLGLRLAEKEKGYRMAEQLAQMPHAGHPVTRWVLANFYGHEKEQEMERRQPEITLLEKALSW